ncbi:MAG: glutamate synthase large subunit [Thermoleophilia bacterium]|nr:glutamate synthase large subunit [Thermoleophilia bacterium]
MRRPIPHIDTLAGTMHVPRMERDSCGAGFVCEVDGVASRRVVDLALGALENLAHRGAVDTDGPDATGDGTGVLLQLPLEFLGAAAGLERVADARPGEVGVGMLFLPPDGDRPQVESRVAELSTSLGCEVLGWREVPTRPEEIGRIARASCPRIAQVFIAQREPAPGADGDAFERTLLHLRRELERDALAGGALAGLYVPSLSSRTIVYKGMLVAGQLARFYPDLADPALRSAIAVFHQRFSTNTFPSWERAQPMRMLAHNGEINTLQGNVAWMRAREARLGEGAFGDDAEWLAPTVDDTSSDSGVLDGVLELLALGGRELPHAVSMLLPPAWEGASDMPADRRAFHAFHAGLMEPWDGPAAISFTDGRTVGAALDRTGLRPARWLRTSDGLVCCSSEAGSVPVDARTVVHRGKLGPGQLLVVDTRRGVVVRDERLGEQLGAMRDWGAHVSATRTVLERAEPQPAAPDPDDLLERQHAAGYTREELTVVLRPMLAGGEEPLGSMGDDTPHAALTSWSRPVTGYLRQRFAEVSNPPIDPIRERATMSLTTLVGPRQALLDLAPAPYRHMQLDGPVLTAEDLVALRAACAAADTATVTLNATFDATGGSGQLEGAIERLCLEAAAAARAGTVLLELDDHRSAPGRAAIPSLLAVGAVHHHLVAQGLRTQVTLAAIADDVRDTHDLACLVGYGAELVHPRLALDTVAAIALEPRAKLDIEPGEAQRRYVHALEHGLLKVMSKMGIATVDSYTAGQVFEVVGLADEIVERCLAGTPSRLGGIGFRELAGPLVARALAPDDGLESPGFYKFKRDGEHHAFNPASVKRLHTAVTHPDVLESGFEEGRELYRAYSDAVHEAPPVEPRDLLEVRGIGRRALDVSAVEPARLILRRISTGAISHGSIGSEAHETLAAAMNRLGGASNSGEGGEAPARFGTHLNSSIKQVASARFGVTPAYLQSARELQIKVAQGSKPGEGGHLPGHKVTAEIAEIRGTVEGTSLISPPPHHDIYSIEDLAQLISDLRAANPLARISVKLVAQAGVGTIAAGVAKARADTIVISGASGGTGASPLSSIKHAGMPWEAGLAEVQQTLRASDLRGRVRLRADGGMRTGRDVVVAALLGADEVSFGTIALVAEGCLMARTCHNNQCPVGIATQRLDLRAKYPGTPERVMAYMRFVAEEVRELLAELGVRSLDDVIGRSDALVQRITGTAGDALDLAPLLAQPDVPDDWDRRHVATLRFGAEERTLDRSITAELWPIVEGLDPAAGGVTVAREYAITNVDRTLGAGLSGAVARFVDGGRLPEGTFDLTFRGSSGQSFGAFTTGGLRLRLVGEANDYVGKGLAGAELVLHAPIGSPMASAPHEHYVMGNTCLYGATSGRLFAAGRAGERFAVRNSGAMAVVEGVGDHGCEYMTGGEVVVIGRIGRNFGAGMTGGRAWVVADEVDVERHLNADYVRAEPPSDEDLAHFWTLLQQHLDLTGSPRAEALLADRAGTAADLRLVVPH